MAGKKLGRPTDKLKPFKLSVRVDIQTLQILDNYCKEHEINRMEGIRRGIRRLND